MYKKISGLLLAVMTVFSTTICSQSFSLNDSTIVFKNAEGKILTKEEVQSLTKETFSIKQENKAGKKIITIIPTDNKERALQLAKMEAFKKTLLNKPLPGFTLTDLDKKRWSSSALKGKVVVVNFWFTACKPCIQEMPDLNELVKANNDSLVVFIAPAPEDNAKIKKFLKKFPFDYHIIPSSIDFITVLNIESFPTHLIIDKQGIVRQVLIGYADDIKEKLQTEIDRIIK